jgi:hypothetical protein
MPGREATPSILGTRTAGTPAPHAFDFGLRIEREGNAVPRAIASTRCERHRLPWIGNRIKTRWFEFLIRISKEEVTAPSANWQGSNANQSRKNIPFF